MRGRIWFLGAVLATLGAALPTTAQRPDYLTPEEVEQVREAQEPNRRVQLFLKFAGARLETFEHTLSTADSDDRSTLDRLQDQLNDFIRAVDDTAGTLQDVLNRGGADLRKSRKPLEKSGQEFLERLEQMRESKKIIGEEFRWDMEDAEEATQDLLTLATKIPDEAIPPKQPDYVGDIGGEAPPPGKPTLKRKRSPDQPQ